MRVGQNFKDHISTLPNLILNVFVSNAHNEEEDEEEKVGRLYGVHLSRLLLQVRFRVLRRRVSHKVPAFFHPEKENDIF